MATYHTPSLSSGDELLLLFHSPLYEPPQSSPRAATAATTASIHNRQILPKSLTLRADDLFFPFDQPGLGRHALPANPVVRRGRLATGRREYIHGARRESIREGVQARDQGLPGGLGFTFAGTGRLAAGRLRDL